MKKRFLCGILLLMLLGLTAVPGAYGAAAKKLTVMVYMCGSNLESNYGSASADIQEMIDAGLNNREVSVLVMTGGSVVTGEGGYFHTENTGIYEVGNGRIRRVWQSEEALNMGDQGTLGQLMRYGKEHSPAERYALILWDHGGGPLEGVCWDETHDMDHLSLSEVTGALAENTEENKLSWIGFDACLMSSLEVAGQMAPYAEYMVASQETEPAFGWNYAFLRGIENDADGAETGRRIVDAFFEGQENSGEILTLACIDLSAVQDTIRALDPVFTPIEQRLGTEQFLALSGLRMNTTGFGKADPTVSASGYDLVDLKDLVSRMEETEASAELLALLDRTVVYSRANEEGACGLSLYHPYANKEGYAEKWKEAYQSIPFSAGYQQYVSSFGSLLTGETLFRWMDLIARAGAADGSGSYPFEMTLTPEQAENVVGAQLLILRNTMSSRLENHCVLLASCPAEIGEDGILRAEWDGRCLFAEEEDGSLAGPVPFLQTNDGKDNTVIGYYIPEGEHSLQGQTVLYEMDAEDRSEYPVVHRIRVWDDITESFSSRMSFSEEGYGTLMFYNYHRSYPQPGTDRTLPDFQKWPQGSDLYADTINLPNAWKLRFLRQETGEQYYAVFRLIDSQQNAVCSLPAAVPNPNRRTLEPLSGTIERGSLRAELTCVVNSTPEEAGLEMDWTFENRGEQKISIRIAELTINGVRQTDVIAYGYPKAGETDLVTQRFNKYDLTGLDRLESISGVMEMTPADGEKESIPFCFLFDSCDLSPLNQTGDVLAEAKQDGIRMKIMEIRPDYECGWDVYLYMENGTRAEWEASKTVRINGIGLDWWELGPLQPGCSRISPLNLGNKTASNLFPVPDQPFALTYPETNVLQALGQTEIREFELISEGDRHETERIRFEMKAPYPLGDMRKQEGADLLIPVVRPPEDLPALQEDALPVLRENNVYRLLLRRVIAGDGVLALSIEGVNDSDLWVQITSGPAAVNGEPVKNELSYFSLPPHSRKLTTALLKGDVIAAGTEIRELSLSFRDENREADETLCVLTASDPFRMGSLIWRSGEQFAGEPVRGTDVDLAAETNPKALNEEVLVPEDFRACLKEVEVQMDPEELSQVRSAKIAMVRPGEEEGYYEVLTLQDWNQDHTGRFVFLHPGLFPTLAGDDQIGVWTYWKQDALGISGTVAMEVTVTTQQFKTLKLDGIRWRLSRETGQAKITAVEEPEKPYGYQSDLLTAGIQPLEVLVVPDADGVLPHLGKMQIRSSISYFMRTPGVRLNGEPLQLALRPVREDEEIYFLVSVTLKDGKAYSLPLIPYN